MKLGAEPVALANDCGNLASVTHRCSCRWTRIAGEAVGEIEIVAISNSKVGIANVDLGPAHVRHRASGFWLKRAHAARDQPKTGSIALLATLEQQLHPKADPECRL